MPSRPYRSPLREQRALETKRRIRRSAWELFAERGFRATTIGQIAQSAGVSPQTVYAVFGSKGGIVSAMLEQLEHEAGLHESIAQIAAEKDPARQLRLFVSANRRLFEVGAPLLRAFMAARHDPDVAAAGDRGDQGRREGATHLTRGFAAAGALCKGLEPDEAAERLWLLTSLEQYLLATDGLGWSPDRYEQWLGNLLEAELLNVARHPSRVIVDAMNVIGSRPTGWWRDRPGAIRTFVARLRAYADHHETLVTVVIDGRPLPDVPEGRYGHLEVRYAQRAGSNAADDRIVDVVRELGGAAEVITADRDLRDRVGALGATTAGPSTLLRALDALDRDALDP